MAPDVRQLRALVAVTDEGTFTDAAIALGTSQASVSRAVADLEREVGATLLLRTNQGALPTAIGRAAVEHARRVLLEVAALGRLSERTAAHLRVGFAFAAFGRLTTPIHRAWRSAHPDGLVTYVQTDTPTAALLDGECELAILRREISDARLATAYVGTEPRVAGVAADDPLARRRHLMLADLSSRTVLVDATAGTTTLDLWPRDAAPTPRQSRGIESWLTAVASGDVVGVTSRATAEQFPRPGVRYRRLKDAPPLTVRLGWLRDDPPAGANAFRRLVRGHYDRR